MKYRVMAKFINGASVVTFAEGYDRATAMETALLNQGAIHVTIAPEVTDEELGDGVVPEVRTIGLFLGVVTVAVIVASIGYYVWRAVQ